MFETRLLSTLFNDTSEIKLLKKTEVIRVQGHIYGGPMQIELFVKNCLQDQFSISLRLASDTFSIRLNTFVPHVNVSQGKNFTLFLTL